MRRSLRPLAIAGAGGRFLLLLVLLIAQRGFASPIRTLNLGPIVSRLEDPRGAVHLRVLGPFFDFAESTNAVSLNAYRPLYSDVENPEESRALCDYLWPLGTYRQLGNQSVSRMLFWFAYNHDLTNDVPQEKLWLLPLYFSGRDATGASYRALFPLGGTIREFLGRDEITFVLFPIWVRSQVNDVKTTTWLWPILSSTHGPRDERFRVFPLYGYSMRDGDYDRRFVLWPLWTQVDYLDPKVAGSGYMLWPLWGHVSAAEQDTWWVLPPLVKWADSKQMTQINAPWPFFQYARSKKDGVPQPTLFVGPEEADYSKLFIWPVWGRKQINGLDSSFAVWPIFWWHELQRTGRVQHRFMIAPFWISQKETSKNTGESVQRETALWPVYRYQREDDQVHFNTLNLWPFAAESAVDRNWAPLWSLFTYDRVGGASDTELLWGLYRRQVRPASKSTSVFPLIDWAGAPDHTHHAWSFLKGFLGRERVGDAVQWKLLYFIRIGNLPEVAP